MAAEWDDLEVKRPELWCARMADERFVELLTPGDICHAHGMGVWIDDLHEVPSE
jgi:hypothetical protein